MWTVSWEMQLWLMCRRRTLISLLDCWLWQRGAEESLQYDCLTDAPYALLLQKQLVTLIPLCAYALTSYFKRFTSSQRGDVWSWCVSMKHTNCGLLKKKFIFLCLFFFFLAENRDAENKHLSEGCFKAVSLAKLCLKE